MAEIYRIEKGSEEWKYKAYDYVRTDAFCFGQNIPIESVYDHHAPKKDEEPKKPKKDLGFTCVLVEKYV